MDQEAIQQNPEGKRQRRINTIKTAKMIKLEVSS